MVIHPSPSPAVLTEEQLSEIRPTLSSWVSKVAFGASNGYANYATIKGIETPVTNFSKTINAGCFGGVPVGKSVTINKIFPVFVFANHTRGDGSTYRWIKEWYGDPRVPNQSNAVEFFRVMKENFPEKTGTDLQINYRKFLVDPTLSPFRKLFPYFEFVYLNDTPTGMILRDSSIDARSLFNFAIATRAAWEHPRDLLNWNLMVKNGIDPRVALYLMSEFQATLKSLGHVGNWDEYLFSGPRLYAYSHWAFNTRTLSLSKMFSGEIPVKQYPYGGGNRYTPCNAIWDIEDKSTLESEVKAMMFPNTEKKVFGTTSVTTLPTLEQVKKVNDFILSKLS